MCSLFSESYSTMKESYSYPKPSPNFYCFHSMVFKNSEKLSATIHVTGLSSPDSS